MVKSEKSLVFDQATGNPKEIRYYEDDKLVARWEIILDKDANFIGIRNLEVEEVAPSSWLDWFKRRKAKPIPVTIQTVDFIGLINWINTIKTIKTIENIDLIKLVDKITLIDDITNIGTLNLLNTVNLIKSISSIDEITNIKNVANVEHATIDEITTIRDLTWSQESLIANYNFAQGMIAWAGSGIEIVDGSSVAWIGNVCHFLPNMNPSQIEQGLPMGIDPTWGTIKFYLRANVTTADLLRVYYFNTDNSISYEDFGCTVADIWQLKTLAPPKSFANFRFRKMYITTQECWIGHIFMVF